MADDYCRDPDDLYGETITATVGIYVYGCGAMKVEGCIDNEPVALKMCDEAIEALKRKNARKTLAQRMAASVQVEYTQDPVKGREVLVYLRLDLRRNGSMSIEGCIEDEFYARAMIDGARDTIRAHNRKSTSEHIRTLVPAHDTPFA